MQKYRFLHLSLTIFLLFLFLIPNSASADPPDRCPCFSLAQIAGIAMAADDIKCLDYNPGGSEDYLIDIVINDKSLANFVARDDYCHSLLGGHLRATEDPDPKAEDCLEILEQAANIIYENREFCECWCPYTNPDCFCF
jgi:hypothetical protein